MAGLNVRIRVSGAAETVAACRQMSHQAQSEFRDEATKIANELVPKLRGAAIADGRQSAKVAPTVRAQAGVTPAVTAGGPLVFASEFGQNARSGWYARRRYVRSRGRQWHPHLGGGSYWFFRTIERNIDDINRMWLRALDRLIRRWGSGG